MIARVVWHFPALMWFYNVSPPLAASVDRALVRLAETGEGVLEWDPPYHRLRAGRHDAILAIDIEARTITVLRIFRAR